MIAATAQAAALFALEPRVAPTVIRVNVAGRYATVLISGGKMEGSFVDAPILVEHFSFGWQALTLVNDGCDLPQGGPSSQTAILLRGMPRLPTYRGACLRLYDFGPIADVEAIRERLRGPLVPYVVVQGAFALGDWYGAGGGQNLYHRENGNWTRIAGGGGAMNVSELRRLGVPLRTACNFVPSPPDEACSRR